MRHHDTMAGEWRWRWTRGAGTARRLPRCGSRGRTTVRENGQETGRVLNTRIRRRGEPRDTRTSNPQPATQSPDEQVSDHAGIRTLPGGVLALLAPNPGQSVRYIEP
jgi:hypothetical protein